MRDVGLLQYAEDRRRIETTLQAEKYSEGIRRYIESIPGRIMRINPQSQATRNALEARLTDVESNGSLRTKFFVWLESLPCPTPDADDGPHTNYGSVLTTRFVERFTQAFQQEQALYVANSSADFPPQRLSSSPVDQLEWFIGEPGRRAILFLLQFCRIPSLLAPASLVEAI